MWLLAVLLLVWVGYFDSYALKPLKTRTVDVGEMKLSTLGVGTWSWGNRFVQQSTYASSFIHRCKCSHHVLFLHSFLWQYSEDDDVALQETFDYLLDAGVNWFDTADSYGTGELKGQSEKLLGKFDVAYMQKKNLKTSKCKFATKLAPFPSRIGSESMYKAGLESIGRLQRSIDIVQLHWPPYWVVPQVNRWFEKEYFTAFDRLIKENRAVQIGVSNYGANTMRVAQEVAISCGSKIYTNQVQFSMLSRYPLENGLADACEDLGIQLIGYSPLALGLLSDKYTLTNLPKGPRALLFKEFLPKIQNLLDVLRDIAKKRRKTVSQVVLNWNLQKGFLLLVGVRNVLQAKENLGAVGWALSDGEIMEIDNAARKVKGQLVQNSFQTK